jgi:signal transduction histidine kinase
MQQLIFERFIQVDESLSRLCEGSGVGLALVKLLVNLHQGTIFVESEPNLGSTFTIVLPVYLLQEEAAYAMPQYEYSKSLNEKISIEFSDVYIY